MFAAIARGGTASPALVAGFLSQTHQFGAVTSDRRHRRLQMHCDGDGVTLKESATMQTDWALLHPLKAAGAQPFAAYMSAVQIANAARTDKAVPTGWCSWYHFFEQVLYCTSS